MTNVLADDTDVAAQTARPGFVLIRKLILAVCRREGERSTLW
jgi:hypothetical protein